MTAHVWLLLIQLCTGQRCETLAVKGPMATEAACVEELARLEPQYRGLCERRG